MKDQQDYQSCIEACLRCAAASQECASFCLKEEDVATMAKCIQLDMECAAICYACAELMSLGSQHAMEICSICADICEACARECNRHENDHCQRCAVECNACAEECRKMEFSQA